MKKRWLSWKESINFLKYLWIENDRKSLVFLRIDTEIEKEIK